MPSPSKILPQALLFSLLFSTPTLADNTSSYDWSGPYLGLSAGYGQTTGAGGHYCLDPWGELNSVSCQKLPDGADPVSSAKGALAGVFAGYSTYLTNTLIIGAEADLSWSSLSGDQHISGPMLMQSGIPVNPLGEFETSYDLEWMGTLRARLGYQFLPNSLLYATGGLAYGKVSAKSSFNAANAGTTYTGSYSDVEFGWTAGLGAEQALENGWQIRLEGLYFDLGEIETASKEEPLAFLPNGYKHNASFELKGGVVRLGLSRKF